jgi:hypothetical protein
MEWSAWEMFYFTSRRGGGREAAETSDDGMQACPCGN